MADKLYYCTTCRKTLKEENFYTSNNREKYPDDGKLPTCKQCTTMFVDNWNPETYTWILKEIDVPYIPAEWNKLMVKFAKDPEKVTGTTILGRYISKMKLKQYRDYRWADTQFLQDLADKEIRETMTRQGYSAAEITTAINKNIIEAPPRPEMPANSGGGQVIEDYFAREDNDLEFDITEEEKQYLRLKWGRTYKIEELVRLEQLYEEMMNSYDIQTAGHIDTLKLVCKTSLKANQLLDIGD